MKSGGLEVLLSYNTIIGLYGSLERKQKRFRNLFEKIEKYLEDIEVEKFYSVPKR